MIPFGQTVLSWRLQRGLTQEELARRAGVARPNLSAIERGAREVSLKTVRALAVALDVRPGVLVDGVLPHEEEEPCEMSREAMERVADAVAQNVSLSDPSEQALAEQLKHLVSSRLRAGGPASKGSTLKRRPEARPERLTSKGAAKAGRVSDRAWLSLSCYPGAVVESLVARIIEHSKGP